MLGDGKLVAISPFFDDAVVSCGGLLASRPDSTVLTVYSGEPPEGGSLTDWDRCCGFQDARLAMRTRRDESAQALSLLGVRGEQMDLLDEQYALSTDGDRLTSALATALATLRPRVILTPLGLCHAAQVRVCDAVLMIRGLFRRTVWLAYEEAAYRKEPGLVQQRLAELLRRDVTATPVSVAASGCEEKLKAVGLYASRSQALGCNPARQHAEAHTECYWRLGARHAAL